MQVRTPMVLREPILVFDTSVINQLTDYPEWRVLTAGLTSAYSVRLTGPNISELAATSKPEENESHKTTCPR